jgi:peptidoglycan/LPS O-acetylase OafA/YrhL
VKGRVFFPGLDGLRFIAFFLVYLEHAFEGFLPFVPAGSPGWRVVSNLLLENGELGVSVFFVLSGFLITYLLLEELGESGRVDVPSFYARRALRIWPLYYATAIFSFVVYPWLKAQIGIHSPATPDAAYYFSFLSNFAVIDATHAGFHLPIFDGVLWSVAVEEQFYLFWPLLFAFLPRKSYPWIFAASISASLGFRVAHADDHGVLYFHTLSVISDLAVGGLAADSVVRWPGFKTALARLSIGSRLGIYALGIAGCVLWPLGAVKHPGWVYGRLGFELFFAFLILDQCFGREGALSLSRCRFMSFWGRYTYGLYLLHPLALTLLLAALKAAHVSAASVGATLGVGGTGFVLSLASSYASFRWFEGPFLKLKKRFSPAAV